MNIDPLFPPRPDAEEGYYERRMRQLAEAGELSLDADMIEPTWLVNGNFFCNVWKCVFGKQRKAKQLTIDFNITLTDGTQLVDPQNIKFLNMLKLLLLVQVTPRFNTGKVYKPLTMYNKLRSGLHACDWLILNFDSFQFSKAGLSLLTSKKVREYLLECGQSNIQGAYQYDSRLCEWLLCKSQELSRLDIIHVGEKYPSLYSLPDPEDRKLDLSDQQLIRIRAYILKEGLFLNKYGEIKFRHVYFTRDVFRQTLFGHHLKPEIPSELIFGESTLREFEAVPIRADHKIGISKDLIKRPLRALKGLVTVSHLYIDLYLGKSVIPLSLKSLVANTEVRVVGRYRTLPFISVYTSLRLAIEFFLVNSERVFGDVALHLEKFYAEIGNDYDIDRLEVHNKVCHDLFGGAYDGWETNCKVARESDYFDRLRSSPSLIHKLRVLQSTCLVIAGVLFARRQDEICELREGCLHPPKNPFTPENQFEMYSLEFQSEKTGDEDARETLLLPIPNIVAKVIWRIEEFNKSCRDAGLSLNGNYLFQSLHYYTGEFRSFTARYYNKVLDVFSDFFETPVIRSEEGVLQRFYVRQHQFRRFFAQVIYFSGSFDSVDVLRYFLGHNDPEQYLHYVTEPNSGDAITVVKAEALSHYLLNGTTDRVKNLEALRRLLEERYNAVNVSMKCFADIYDDYSYQVNVGAANWTITDSHAELNLRLEADVESLLKQNVIGFDASILRVSGINSPVEEISLVVVVNEI